MSKSDVVVIGNGLAGLMSALVSADQGKKVTLLSYGAGTFPLNSGVIDVLGYDDSGKAVANPAQAVSAVADEHPYKKIGTQALEESVKFFQDVVAAEGFPYVGSLNEQQWLVTGVGTLKPSCLVPESMQGSKCFEASEIVLVGIKGLKDYYVDMVAENLAKELGNDKKYTVVTVDPHYQGARDLTTKDVASWMDTEAGYADFVSQVKGNAGAGKVILVPQILGLKGNVVYKNREFSYDNLLTELIRHTIEFIKRKEYGNALLVKVKDEVKSVISSWAKDLGILCLMMTAFTQVLYLQDTGKMVVKS